MNKRTRTKHPQWRCPGTWTAAQRLSRFTKIDPLSGCHIWQRSTKPNGYGQLTFRCQRWMTHRLAWVARHGPIAKGLEVCHRCNERRCCNPDHLYLSTHAENMAVMGATRRALRRIPLEGLRDDLPDADMAPIRVFIGDREYIGHAAVRAFDPLRIGAGGTGQPHPEEAAQRPSRRMGCRQGALAHPSRRTPTARSSG